MFHPDSHGPRKDPGEPVLSGIGVHKDCIVRCRLPGGPGKGRFSWPDEITHLHLVPASGTSRSLAMAMTVNDRASFLQMLILLFMVDRLCLNLGLAGITDRIR
jgi:hypothetical protein